MLQKHGIRAAGVALGAGLLFATTAFQAEAAPRRHYRGGNAGAAVAAGILGLGVAAAIASSRSNRNHYYAPGYAYPAYGYSYGAYPAYSAYPVYSYGYAQPVYPRYAPRYPYAGYYGPTGYGRGNYYQRRARNTQQYHMN
jgi:hypothetical protein